MTAPRPSLFDPLLLPNGTVLKNRVVKSAMSDALGDGRGRPTEAQVALYATWAAGGAAASIVGEVQADARFPEASGNLVLDENADMEAFRTLAAQGGANGTQLWLQLSHAGALTPPALGTPKGPSALDLPGFACGALKEDEIAEIPARVARSARRAEAFGFAGVEVHAAHGFLLNQFLSPLFNQRSDGYGGSLENRARLLVEVVKAVRTVVSDRFTVALKLNATDQLEGGFDEAEALQVIGWLDGLGLDLIDISGGTYFPGAASSSDRSASGPYFTAFAAKARRLTGVPLMATGGFKRREEAEEAVASGAVDVVGLARAMILDPALPARWHNGGGDPAFPRFEVTPDGGMTAWYTLAIARIAGARKGSIPGDLHEALAVHTAREAARDTLWRKAFFMS